MTALAYANGRTAEFVRQAEASARLQDSRVSRAQLEVRAQSGFSVATAVYSTNPLKLLTPRARGPSVWACVSSFGGGLVAGDQTRLDISVGTNARCYISTQASTKVYRNPGGFPCRHTTHAALEPGALLVFAPDPIQPFAGSLYEQRQEWHLADRAALVWVDWFSSGRVARGERWAFTRFKSRNDVFLGSERILIDSLLLEPANRSSSFADPSFRFNCFATVLFIGTLVADLVRKVIDAVAQRPVECRAPLLCCASPIRQGVLLRLASQDVESAGRELRGLLQPLTHLLGDDPWARKW